MFLFDWRLNSFKIILLIRSLPNRFSIRVVMLIGLRCFGENEGVTVKGIGTDDILGEQVHERLFVPHFFVHHRWYLLEWLRFLVIVVKRKRFQKVVSV